MSQTPIPISLRRQVAREAEYRCGYCLCSELLMGMPMELDHLLPESRGGRTARDNLWLACPQCNGYKAGRVRQRDPLTGRLVPLFNPRRDRWAAHFRWVNGGLTIEGKTSIGRASVAALRMNLRLRVTARAVWIAAGWHPPLG